MFHRKNVFQENMVSKTGYQSDKLLTLLFLFISKNVYRNTLK